MSRLAACLFEWDEGDVRPLGQAKRQELEASGVRVQDLTDRAVWLVVMEVELARHCRRHTVGVTWTAASVEDLSISGYWKHISWNSRTY